MTYTVRRIYTNQGGYDRFGCYWGVGIPVYGRYDRDGTEIASFRAASRHQALLFAAEKAGVLQWRDR